MTLLMTPERRRVIAECIEETQRKLDKELSISPDLQKQDRVAFYRSHLAKLEDDVRLADGEVLLETTARRVAWLLTSR